MESLPPSLSTARRDRPSSPWLTLFHPMLLVSLLLHGLFLMMPVASTPVPAEEEVAEELEKPEEAIALSALRETPKPAQSAPKAVPTPSPRFTPIQRVQPNPSPVPNIAPSPSPSPVESVQPSASPEASTDVESETGSGDITSEVTSEEPISDDLANMRSNLMASLGSTNGLIGQPPPVGYFRQPELYFNQPDNGDPGFTKDANVWLPGIVGIDWYNDTRPDAAIAQFESQFTTSGAVMEEIQSGYGGRRLFAISQNGNPLLYLNIIPAPGNISTVVVQWDRDPNTPPPPQ